MPFLSQYKSKISPFFMIILLLNFFGCSSTNGKKRSPMKHNKLNKIDTKEDLTQPKQFLPYLDPKEEKDISPKEESPPPQLIFPAIVSHKKLQEQTSLENNSFSSPLTADLSNRESVPTTDLQDEDTKIISSIQAPAPSTEKPIKLVASQNIQLQQNVLLTLIDKSKDYVDNTKNYIELSFDSMCVFLQKIKSRESSISLAGKINFPDLLGSETNISYTIEYSWLQSNSGMLLVEIPEIFIQKSENRQSGRTFFKRIVFDTSTQSFEGFFGKKISNISAQKFLNKYNPQIPPFFYEEEEEEEEFWEVTNSSWYVCMKTTLFERTLLIEYSPIGFIKNKNPSQIKNVLSSIEGKSAIFSIDLPQGDSFSAGILTQK